MVIEASSIEKWYFRGKANSNRFFAVHPANLTVEPGILTVLTGRSGSGKTILLHMLSGILLPSGGTVSADGQNLYAMDDRSLSAFRNRHMGMIPQGADLLSDLTVMENILLPAGIYGKKVLPRERERIRELMQKLGILDFSDIPARELSGGERRRVCVARALAVSPEVVFADEPTSDLDHENSYLVLENLKAAAKNGAAVFVETHDQTAIAYADRLLRMDAGTVSEQ